MWQERQATLCLATIATVAECEQPRFSPILTLHHTTPRLILRPLAEPDRAEFIRLHTLSADHLLPWSPAMPEGQTFDQLFDDRLARTRTAAADNSAARLAAFALAPPHRLIGFFSLNNIVRGVFQSTDAGWLISADVINQGFATEGVAALLDIAFHTLNLHRVQANIIPTNLASLRVARKVGFREEGRAQRMLKIANEWQDHIMFAKLADEHPPRATF